MSRLRKPLLWAGLALLVIFGALLGYASYREEEFRTQFKTPVAMDYGFVPLDLLEGRTRFEGRDKKAGIHGVNTGPPGESRIAMARAGCGAGALAVVLLLIRAFMTKKQ